MGYDGFISYSHDDAETASRLQSGLQQFAKPWWRRRALHVFRDDANLGANPALWESIASALDDSEWLVVLLSPDAAQSEWVDREVAHWVASDDCSRVLLVLLEGEFGWRDGDVYGDIPPSLEVRPRPRQAQPCRPSVRRRSRRPRKHDAQGPQGRTGG
jgi:hypothetical protein